MLADCASSLPERILGDDHPQPSTVYATDWYYYVFTRILREVNQTLRLVLVREIPEDVNLRQKWNSLVERVEKPQVFYTYEWSLAVQRAYHATLRPLLFLAYDEQDSLCGVAALATDVGGSRASFLCATTGDYCDFLSLPEHKTALVAGVLAALREQRIGEVTLTNLPADSDTVAAIQKLSRPRAYRCFMRTAYVCAQVSLGKLERRPNDKKPVLPGRKMVRRSLSAMGRGGPVRLDHARSWNEVESILPQFMRSHVARFLATGRISNVTRPERCVFLAELAKLLAESGWLTLTRMMSGNDALAWNYGFQFQGAWFWYQPTFESGLEKFSPGFCLLAKLIEEAAENPALNIVDLGLGAEEYKERFANQTRETLYVTLRTSVAHHAREILRYRAAEIVKTLPRLEAALRAAVACLQRLKESLWRDGITGTLQHLVKRVGGRLWSETEVLFFEWNGGPSVPYPGAARLEALDLNQLATAASQYADDKATLAYLLRSACRLREGNADGFGFIDSDGRFLCFAWVTAFDGLFLPELNAKVDAPSADSVMLFEGWTPVAARGYGYYGQTIGLITKRMQKEGKKPWVYSATSNLAAVEEVEKAGFQRRYALVRRRVLGWQLIKGKTPRLNQVLSAEVSPRI